MVLLHSVAPVELSCLYHTVLIKFVEYHVIIVLLMLTALSAPLLFVSNTYCFTILIYYAYIIESDAT